MIIRHAPDMSDEEFAAYRDGNRKFERRIVVTVSLITLVALTVLLIDQGIKKSVLDAVAQARKILDEFNTRADVMTYGRPGTPEAGSDRDGADPGVDAGGVVVHAAAAGAVLDPAAVAAPGAQADEPASAADGVAGDG